MLRRRKHFMTAVCLAVGLVVLTTAVYANYDNANGYNNYKSAIKQLAFEEENYTAEMVVSMEVDGKVLERGTVKMKMEKGKKNTVNLSENPRSNEATRETYTYETPGKQVNYYSADNTYWESNYNNSFSGNSTTITPLIPRDDTSSKKATRFAELFIDTMIGDLKNNVVLISDEDGLKNYGVTLSKEQVPELINAGLSLMFAGADRQYFDGQVDYEDWSKSYAVYYKEQTGKEYVQPYEMNLSEEEMEKYWEEENKISEGYDKKYRKEMEGRGNKGVLFVKADGSTEYYATTEAYMNKRNEVVDENTIWQLGLDPYVEKAICNVTLDKEGRLVYNYLEGTLKGIDRRGNAHTMTMKMEIKISDYGTTVAEDFDPTGKINQKDLYSDKPGTKEAAIEKAAAEKEAAAKAEAEKKVPEKPEAKDEPAKTPTE